MQAWLDSLRRTRWATLCVVNLRFLIGFAFLPAALKKILDQPFTDPSNTGAFHDFLHAFRASGWFYQFVGGVQLVAAVLMCTQRFAFAGAVIALPVLTAISAFCWSTRVIPTATVATLMWLGTAALVIWDADRLRAVQPGAGTRPVELSRWQWCGLAIIALYLGVCALEGGIYRPRGLELDNPAFFVLPAIACLPVVTLVLDLRARRAARAKPGAGAV